MIDFRLPPGETKLRLLHILQMKRIMQDNGIEDFIFNYTPEQMKQLSECPAFVAEYANACREQRVGRLEGKFRLCGIDFVPLEK